MTVTFSDRELIEGCLAGDKTVSEAFVRHFSRLVFGTIQSVFKSKGALVDRYDIEDLHNTVFISFFEKRCKKLQLYEGRNGCSLATWVRMVTVRVVLDHLRRRTDLLSRPERLIPIELAEEKTTAMEDSPWACMATKEQLALIKKAMQSLPERDRLIIQMHCLEDRPLGHMAVILKVSKNNVHSVKHRAVKRLQEAVNRLMESAPNEP